VLRINKSREVWWPAKINVPEDDGKTRAFDARLRIRIPSGTEPAQSDREFVEQHVIGWEQVSDEAGNALPFTPENLSAALDIPYVLAGFARALVECSRGIAAKN
jgi:hypothetical protein